ncbi:hypothetical protein KH5_22640 [Urechidicola sp. KH5]
MKLILKTVFILVSIVLLSSCSLLDIKLESETVPLETDQIITRNLIHDYALTFFHEVPKAADSIFAITDKKEVQINSILWKIAATRQAKGKMFQTDPKIALLDTWLLVSSMNDYFKEGIGKDVFEEQQPIAHATCKDLLDRIDQIAQRSLKEEYSVAFEFIDSIKRLEPNHSQDLYKESVANAWYAYRNVPDSLAGTNVGTLPQVLSDLSTRLTVTGEQSLYQVQWVTELMLRKSEIDSIDLARISENFNESTDNMIAMLKEGGNELQKESAIFRRDFRLLIENFNHNLDSLTVFASEELAILRDSLSAERAAIMKDFDTTADKAVNTAMSEARKLIEDIMGYLTFILFLILCVPFVMGLIVGRIFERIKNKSK